MMIMMNAKMRTKMTIKTIQNALTIRRNTLEIPPAIFVL